MVINKIAKSVLNCYISVLFSGFIRYASGTFGSIASVLLYYLLGVNCLPVANQLFILLAVFFVAIFAIGFYTSQSKNKDPKEVVIDEFIGITASLIICRVLLNALNLNLYFEKPIVIFQIGSISTYFTNIANADVLFFISFVLLNFVFFRIFDIFKPFPCNFFDKKIKNSFGVIMDDFVAGFYSAVLSFICLVMFFV